MDVPGISRPVLVGLALVAALLFAAGASKAVSLLTRHTDTHTRTLPATSNIDVDTGSGDVHVVAEDRDDVRLVSKARRSVWGGPTLKQAVAAGRLRLSSDCRTVADAFDDCSVSYLLEIPRDMSVHLVGGTGDLHAEDVGGSADLRTGTGDIHVTGARGTLRLRTGTGDIDADVRAADLEARTGTGDVELRAADPTRMVVQTGTGDIEVHVPDLAYDVAAHAGTGDENVDVRTDPNASRTIVARTGTGDLHIAPDR